MYTNTDTKNQTRHMHRCKKWPEVFTRKGSTLHSLSQTGDKHSVMAAQKPCDPSSVLEYIVLTSWHPRNQSVPASWYNVIWHCHTRNLFQLPGTMSSDTVTQRIKSVPNPASWCNVTWHCHPRNQSVPASWYNVIWHCHPRNQPVPASWYNVIWHCHPKNQSVPASWYNVIWHCHPRNQSVPAFWYNVIWHCHPKNQVWHSQCHLTLSPKESVCSSSLQRGNVNCYHQPWNGSTLTSWTWTVVN